VGVFWKPKKGQEIGSEWVMMDLIGVVVVVMFNTNYLVV
jgi:hypothetical protein